MKEKIFIVYQSKDMQNITNNFNQNEKSTPSFVNSHLQSQQIIKEEEYSEENC